MRKHKSIFKKMSKKARQNVGYGIVCMLLGAACSYMGYIGGKAEGERIGRRSVLDQPIAGRYPWREEEEEPEEEEV